jgi:solute carrier family 8 (sodium/calcium exchanger)
VKYLFTFFLGAVHKKYLIIAEPGTLQFEKRGYLVKESCGDAEIAILRQNGADGAVAVHWRTIDKTAINGKDYQGGEGLIEFNHGEVGRLLLIPKKELAKLYP